MDIESLKEALGDEKFSALKTYVDDLVGQRDAARNESINGRKGLKEKLASLENAQSTLMERLGIESLDDLENLPDAKGAAEAAKQYEAKLKRLERQYAEEKQQREEISGKYRGSLQKAAIAEALSGHEFIARDIVETFVSQRLTWEGDDLLFRSDDGRLIPVKDGVAGIAKSRPEILKPTGSGGAGVRSTNAGSGGGAKTMTRSEFEAMAPAQKLEAAKSGVQLV
jgi:hypothetical protein